MVSPPAVKFTLLAKLPALVGWNRRVTVRLAPGDSEKEPPDAMLNGAPTFAPPEMLAVLVFCTVNVRSTMPPVVTFPKFVAMVGVTLKTGWPTPIRSRGSDTNPVRPSDPRVWARGCRGNCAVTGVK
jgi:hypothetical protein